MGKTRAARRCRRASAGQPDDAPRDRSRVRRRISRSRLSPSCSARPSAEIDALPGPQAQALRRALGLEEAPGRRSTVSAVGVATLGVLAALALRGGRSSPSSDDLQWVDEPSRASLSFVARRLSRLHVALLCAAREGEIPEAAGRYAAAPARRGCVRETRGAARGLGARPARSRGQTQAPRALRRQPARTRRAADRALRRAAPGDRRARRADSRSTAASSARSGRVSRGFPERTRQALLLAVAAGSDADEPVAAALRKAGLDVADLEPAASSIGSSSSRTATSRSATRSSARSSTTERERGVEACRPCAARGSRSRRRSSSLASRLGGRSRPTSPWRLELDEAAGRALARGAPGSAVRAFEAAARFSAADEARGKRLALAARAAHRAGDVASAARHATAARQLASDPITHADLLLVESDLRMREGDFEGAHRALMEHAERLVEIDRRRATTMLLLALKVRIYRLEGRAAVDEVERVLAMLPAGEQELVHLVALSMSRTVAGTAGARDSALAAAAAAASAPHGHAHTLGIAWPLIWLEEYDMAREVTDRATAVQREAGFLLYLPQSLLPQAELDFRTGRWETAVSAAAEALSLFEETQQPSEAASASAVLARMEAARGRAEECQALAQRALASDVEFGLRSAAAQALASPRSPCARLSPASGRDRSARDGRTHLDARRRRRAVAPDVCARSRRGTGPRRARTRARARSCTASASKPSALGRVSAAGGGGAVRRDPRRRGALAGRVRGGARAPRSGADAVRACTHRALLRGAAAPGAEACGGSRATTRRDRGLRRARRASRGQSAHGRSCARAARQLAGVRRPWMR